LQTAGKTYLATRDNIARYTEGRFAPQGLSTQAPVLANMAAPPHRPLATLQRYESGSPALLLVTPEDLNPESLFEAPPRLAAAIVAADADLLWGRLANNFVHEAASDAAMRVQRRFGCPVQLSTKLDAANIVAAAGEACVRQVVVAAAPVGPVTAGPVGPTTLAPAAPVGPVLEAPVGPTPPAAPVGPVMDAPVGPTIDSPDAPVGPVTDAPAAPVGPVAPTPPPPPPSPATSVHVVRSSPSRHVEPPDARTKTSIPAVRRGSGMASRSPVVATVRYPPLP
jgi:hypothetical protein